MMTRREIYSKLYTYMKKVYSNPSVYWTQYNPELTIEDNASRMANIFAVQNTEKAFQQQNETGTKISLIIFDELEGIENGEED